MNPTRSGLLTSEFLTTIVGQFVGFMVMTGHVTVANQDQYTQALVTIIGGLISVYTAVAYIWSRTSIKKAVISGQNAPKKPVTNATITTGTPNVTYTPVTTPKEVSFIANTNSNTGK